MFIPIEVTEQIYLKGGILVGNLSTLSIIKYIVGFVFVVSGLMKLIDDSIGVFFTSLGLPSPIAIMYLVAITEIICGILIILNKYVAQAIIPLIGIIIVAILMTKVPIMHNGFVQALFEARLDIVMLILLLVLYSQYGSQKWTRS